jgi:alpha-N-arabinofuranosidase
MGAALGDAAWMTGMERNSDVIVMASYAPLLTNVNAGALQWETDLIGYDAVTSYGSPAYYAQVLFGSHLGTEVIGSELSGAGPRLFVSTTRNPADHTIYLKLVNGSSAPQSVQIHLNGIAGVSKDAHVSTLTGSTPEETNTITNPERIVPVASVIHTAGTQFEHTVPGYSIEVIDLSIQ